MKFGRFSYSVVAQTYVTSGTFHSESKFFAGDNVAAVGERGSSLFVSVLSRLSGR